MSCSGALDTAVVYWCSWLEAPEKLMLFQREEGKPVEPPIEVINDRLH